MVQFTVDDKSEFQTADWSERPLSASKLDYAANDSYYLGHIAATQLEKVISAHGDNKVIEWIEQFNHRVTEATYSMKRENFNSETYRKPFRKFMDFFDPTSDEFLTTELVYRDLYQFRELLSQLLDVNKKSLFCDDLLGLIARLQPRSTDALNQIFSDHSILPTKYQSL
jgi:hypothetical protein